MTWTYGGDPAANDRDKVRFLIGDTDTNDQQVSDEEIAYLLTSEGSVPGAAVAAVQALIAKFSRLVDKSVGDLSISYSQRVGQYEKLLRQLVQRRALRTGTPYAGGISESDKDTVEADTDRVRPEFYKGQFSHPGATDPAEDDED